MDRERNGLTPDGGGDLLDRRHGPGLSVLLVDDDLQAAFELSIAIRLQGHRVEMTLAGPEALEIAREKPPDVVFVEVDLLDMDGWEIVRRLYAQGQPAGKRPFYIAMARHGNTEDYQRAADLGIDLYLERPLDLGFIRKLLARFERLIHPVMDDCSPWVERGMSIPPTSR